MLSRKYNLLLAIQLIFAVVLAWDLLAAAACMGQKIHSAQTENYSPYYNQAICFGCLVNNGPIPRIINLIGSKPGAMFVAISAIATIFIAWFTYIQSHQTEIIQRAYLSVLPAGIEPWVSDEKTLACDVFFHNAGNLPATHLSWGIAHRIIGDPDFRPPPVSINERYTNIVAAKIQIRKGASPPLESKILIWERSAAEEYGGSCWLYVWGTVHYRDGLKNDRRTDFCHRYNLLGTGKLSRDGLHIGKSYGRQHEFGNATDETS